MVKFQAKPRSCNIAGNTTLHAEGAAASLLLRFHADKIVSHPSARVIPVSQNKTFEELLLQQVKQMPLVKTGRKWICEGAEIMSGGVSDRMKETVSKKCERREQTRKKKTAKKIEEGG